MTLPDGQVRNPIVCVRKRYGEDAGVRWEGDLVEAGDWLVIFFEDPPHLTAVGEIPRFALRYCTEAAPLSLLVSFDERGGVLEYLCEAALPARLEGRVLSLVDLDLDLVVTPGLEAAESDHETFAINRFVRGYPEEVVAAAEAGIRLAWELVRRGTPPFEGSAAKLLGRVLAGRGPV